MKVFEVTPKRVKRVNNTVLTPEMKVIVTIQMHTATPFYNGVKELTDACCCLYCGLRDVPFLWNEEY